MLHAAGFTDAEIPPLLVHGYINIGGAKISKSLGNIVDPAVLAEKYGPGALRYYLMRETATGQDMEFAEDRLVGRYNTDLANDLGNLLNRTLNMAQRYREGVLKRPASETPWLAEGRELVLRYCGQMDHYLVHSALETAMSLASKCNAYIEAQAPWKLAKDPALAGQLDEVLYHLAESLRLLSILIAPVLPEAAQGMAEQLNVAPDAPLSAALDPAAALADGHVLGKPTPLFPRIETEAKP